MIYLATITLRTKRRDGSFSDDEPFLRLVKATDAYEAIAKIENKFRCELRATVADIELSEMIE